MAPIIVKACDPALYDPAQLVEAARRTATLTVPVVKALTDEVAKRDAEAAGYVHWGATSQDVIDTAMVLQLGEALPPLLKELDAIVGAFANLARKHRRTPMLGRTLLQPATPLALGQKIAGWASDIARAARRLEASFKETQVVQFGGASGSLSALGEKAEPVMTSLAKRLKLELPAAPWFTQRVRVAALAQDAALVVGALAKAARDISLMMQVEVGEAAEPSGPGRGGSSTMPHKRNPVGAALVLSAAGRAPMLAATIVAALPQEHERALGGWQAEWPTMAALIETLGLGGAGDGRGRRRASPSIPTPCRPTWTPPKAPCWPSARPSCWPRRWASRRPASWSRRRWRKAARSSRRWDSSRRSCRTRWRCWAIRRGSWIGLLAELRRK